MKKEMTLHIYIRGKKKKKTKWGRLKNLSLTQKEDLQCTTFTFQEKKKSTRTPQKLLHIFLFGLVKEGEIKQFFWIC